MTRNRVETKANEDVHQPIEEAHDPRTEINPDLDYEEYPHGRMSLRAFNDALHTQEIRHQQRHEALMARQQAIRAEMRHDMRRRRATMEGRLWATMDDLNHTFSRWLESQGIHNDSHATADTPSVSVEMIPLPLINAGYALSCGGGEYSNEFAQHAYGDPPRAMLNSMIIQDASDDEEHEVDQERDDDEHGVQEHDLVEETHEALAAADGYATDLEALGHCHDELVEDMHHLTLDQDSQQPWDDVNHEDLGLACDTLEYNAWNDNAETYEYDIGNAYNHAEGYYEDVYAGDEGLAFPYDPGDHEGTYGYDYGDTSSYPFDPGGSTLSLDDCVPLSDHHYVGIPFDPGGQGLSFGA